MYQLYHIKGVKWGMTARTVKRRVWEQGYTLDDVCEIVEESNIDIASELEDEWNIRDGYKRDPNKYNERNYSEIAKLAQLTNEQRSKGGKTAGSNKVKSGLWDTISKKGRMLGNKISCEKQKIKCFAYNKKTHQFIGEFNSISDAANTLNLWRRNVAAVLKGKLKSTGGYYFLTHPKT
jgi:hypothetical protein